MIFDCQLMIVYYRPSTIFRTYGAPISGIYASLRQAKDAKNAEKRQYQAETRSAQRSDVRRRRQEDYIYVLRIIALISFKISLMEGIFDGLISAGVCL